MATCYDCIHQYCCKYDRFFGVYEVENKCAYFKNKANYAEVKHSRWENISGFDVCNICGTSPAYCEPKPNNKKGYPPYCHNCGAKMDGVRKEDV